MDPTTYQQLMVQALMGGNAQPGVMPSSQNPSTAYGASFLTGNPTVPGGMLGSSPFSPVNPMAPPQPQPDPNQLAQLYQSYMPGDHANGGAEH